jgi:predicted transcriptional regulator
VKKDDSIISDASLRNVRKHADLVLRRANALDRLPTPVYDVVAAAKLEISRENIFDAVYLGGLYRRLPNTVKLAPETLKRALGKVLGVFDREERVIHLDGSLHEKKKKFLSIHEVGHDILPWQQKTFSFLEDSEQELDPGTHDLYEREANCFASEVMFQLDRFAAIAEDFAFGIRAPLNLSGKFGSSFYAAARRYVTTRRREACVPSSSDQSKSLKRANA